jgi:hypothetical protein
MVFSVRLLRIQKIITKFLLKKISQMWYHMSVTPAVLEVEAGRSGVPSYLVQS